MNQFCSGMDSRPTGRTLCCAPGLARASGAEYDRSVMDGFWEILMLHDWLIDVDWLMLLYWLIGLLMLLDWLVQLDCFDCGFHWFTCFARCMFKLFVKYYFIK